MKRAEVFIVRSLAGAALVTCFLAMNGCGKGTPRGLATTDLIGTWLEIPETAETPRNNRVVKVARLSPKMRKLTFNADGTYKIELAEPDGTVVDAGKSVTGTWKIEAD